MDSIKHREELGKLLTDTDKSSTASGDSGMYESDENEDDAIELLGKAGTNERHMSHDIRFPIMWYVRSAKPQTSLHISAV